MIANLYYISNYVIAFINLSIIFLKYKLYIFDYNTAIKTSCNQLSKLNIFYVKALQWNMHKIIETNNDLDLFFRQFNNNVPYNNSDINYHAINAIKKYVDKTNQTLIIDNNFKPINSGTIALVFKGTLNNKPVAIKLLRNDIYKIINSGINDVIHIITFANYILSFFCEINNSFLQIVVDNKNLLLEQTDFNKEANNIELYKQTAINYDNIVVPHVYKEFTHISSEIIIMDFLEGYALNQISKDDLRHYDAALTVFAINSYLTHKFVHGDMHIGNIIFLKDYKIGIIDFGLVIPISDKHSKHILDVFFSVKTNNLSRTINSIIKMLLKNKSDVKHVYKICIESESIKCLCNNNAIFTTKEIFELFKIINKINCPIEPTSSKILLSLISSFSIIEYLSNNKPFPQQIRDYFEKLNLNC